MVNRLIHAYCKIINFCSCKMQWRIGSAVWLMESMDEIIFQSLVAGAMNAANWSWAHMTNGLMIAKMLPPIMSQ